MHGCQLTKNRFFTSTPFEQTNVKNYSKNNLQALGGRCQAAPRCRLRLFLPV